MELKFTARAINEIEEIRKKPFTHVLADYSMRTITLFVRKGLNLKGDAEAEAEITRYLEDKIAEEAPNGLMELYLDIMDALKKGALLPAFLDVNELREKMKNPATFQEAMYTLVNSGQDQNS